MVASVLHRDESQVVVRPEDGNDERVAAVATKAFTRVAEAWELRGEDAAALIEVAPRTWSRMKAETWSGRLRKDQLMRISALVGLYKGLHLYFNDELADRWPNLENNGPAFGGRTPLDRMREGGLPAIMETRDYVDALRGGV